MILALLLALSPAPKAQGKLVVLVVVDQLRYQDVLWLSPQFGPHGFAGLGEPRQLRYETVVTETAADHATLGTGAYADLNGIIGNRFWINGAPHDAVEDASCPIWGAPQLGKSAGALKVPTAGDAFKLGTNGAGRVISIAIKDRTALFLGGPSADLALWWEFETGEFASTSCYAKEAPAWLPKHPAEAFKDWVWKPMHESALASLVPEERAEAAIPHYDFGPAFPHPVGQGKLDKRLYLAIRNSPAGTTLALQAARAAVDGLNLGSNGSVDYLALGLSAVDGVGHMYGTHARERVDTILRMHEELGAFLDRLRARLGPRLSVVLTSDHGLTPMAADQKRLRVTQGGAVDLDQLIVRLDQALSDELGPRKWVESIDGSALSLKAPFPARAVELAADALRREPGIWKAIPTAQMDGADADAKHSVFPGRSGQVLIVMRPLWTLKKPTDGADHGSPWNDDALVPLFQQAPGYRFRNEPRFRATQVAPTISLLLGTAPPSAALDIPALERQ
ncbi:MAG TPA: alkaline phosphatase family protein [Myxococcales bacterium]|nr:alkaline phosphatase family protein [Myxococcales bacterium]